MPSHPQSVSNCCTSARIRRFHTAVLGFPFISPLKHTKSTTRVRARFVLVIAGARTRLNRTLMAAIVVGPFLNRTCLTKFRPHCPITRRARNSQLDRG
jgi:hypothetical protein